MLIAPENPGTDTLRVPVIEVFDGDGFLTLIENTLHGTSLEVTIRLGFIDAPELEQPGGQQAKDFLSSLIRGRWVDLAILFKMDTKTITDRHGRIVAVPYLEHRAVPARPGAIEGHPDRSLTPPSFRNIELEMVLNGWAWVLDRYGPSEHYFEALEDAQRNRRGIWAFQDNVHPWEFKRQRYQRRNPPPHPNKSDHIGLSNCPVDGCSGRLVRKDGKYGKFVGCSRFPECRYSRKA